MEKTFNFILIIGILIALYFCIEKYNAPKKNTNSSNKSPNKSEIVEEFNMDKLYNENIPESSKIKFNYEETPIEKEFLKEQESGVNLNSWYPNTWIEKIDENGNPIYNSRENISKKSEDIIEAKAINNYLFDPQRNLNIGGVVDPDEMDTQNLSIKQIYDKSFVDYKKMAPKKNMLDIDPDSNIVNAASNLTFYSPDTWVYENEKPENGGTIYDGISACDPSSMGSVALF